jgi:hypothetical protein
MAKSITRNVPANTAFDVEKIRRFTQQELDKLAENSSDLPLCYQIGTDILVGRYRVVKIDDKTWRAVENRLQLFDFFNRKDAIFYCIALHKQQYRLAQDIRECDSLLSRLEFDAALYRIRYKKAIKNSDEWGEEFYTTRYHETMERITQAKKELTKSLNLAKYIKL